MNPEFKPNGYNSASPYFIVDEAQKLIDFLVYVFDAIQLRRYDRNDGSIMHAEIKIDDSVIMLSNASKEYPAMRLVMHVYVPNVDEIFEKAVSAGCEIIDKPKTREGDPDKRGTFKDFAGNMWSVATQVVS
ncbi:MAG TPA: VOC family protein [Saprospiraceae bacterium]|nr:VOC family protein [Saprospiraceae bacterium]